MKGLFIRNIIKSTISYALISIINFIIYVITYPETMLFTKFPYVFYIGIVLDVIISMIAYSIAGRHINLLNNKLISFLSVSIPAIISSVLLAIGFINKKFMQKYIMLILLGNISCGFLINICIQYIPPCAFIIAMLPTLIIFAAMCRSKSKTP